MKNSYHRLLFTTLSIYSISYFNSIEASDINQVTITNNVENDGFSTPIDQIIQAYKMPEIKTPSRSRQNFNDLLTDRYTNHISDESNAIHLLPIFQASSSFHATSIEQALPVSHQLHVLKKRTRNKIGYLNENDDLDTYNAKVIKRDKAILAKTAYQKKCRMDLVDQYKKLKNFSKNPLLNMR